MFMCGLVRSNFCFDMFAISFVSPLLLWPVDWRPPATELRQGFLKAREPRGPRLR
jgi:hypothetical protein